MKKKTTFEEGFEEGYNDNKDLTVEEFARLCYLLSEDFRIDHNDAGYLIYKLSTKFNADLLSKRRKKEQ